MGSMVLHLLAMKHGRDVINSSPGGVVAVVDGEP
jgi:hypothetical protein